MRRTHRTHLAPGFVVRYWAVVFAVLGLPIVLIAAVAVSAGDSGLAAIAFPWVVSVGAGSLVFWRWKTHEIEVTADAVIERRHPLVWYERRRDLDEIVEVVPCPLDRRGTEHHDSSLLVRCVRGTRDLVVSPANPQQFLDDLTAADPRFVRYQGRVLRTGV